MTSPRDFYTGTVEYLDITVTADVSLDQVVQVAFDDRTTWLDATWQGEAGTTRTASVLLDADTLPSKGTHEVYVRLTDTPEAPVLRAGSIRVR